MRAICATRHTPLRSLENFQTSIMYNKRMKKLLLSPLGYPPSLMKMTVSLCMKGRRNLWLDSREFGLFFLRTSVREYRLRIFLSCMSEELC